MEAYGNSWIYPVRFRFAVPNARTAIFLQESFRPVMTIATFPASRRTSARIRAHAKHWGARLPQAVDSIYLGGGTPSLLSPALLRELFVALRREFAWLPTAEITVRVRARQIDPAVLDALVECGVTRVSFGVQSFVDSEAKAIGRLHNRATALEDIRRGQAAGIADVSVDLIAGLPGQTLDSWYESLARSCRFRRRSRRDLHAGSRRRVAPGARDCFRTVGAIVRRKSRSTIGSPNFTRRRSVLWPATVWRNTRFRISPASLRVAAQPEVLAPPALSWLRARCPLDAADARRFRAAIRGDGRPGHLDEGFGLGRAAPPGSRGRDGRSVVPRFALERGR